MKHSFEIELRETEGREPMLHGTILQEGRAASERREIFAPGSVRWPGTGIEIMPEHRGTVESRAHPIRSDTGELSITARATDALQKAVAAGKRYMSVEFVSLEERTTPGGVREILKAMVYGAALCSVPEYDMTAAELRNKNRRKAWL